MLVESLLEGHRFVPVVAPLGVARDGSTAYNINGDTAAGALAGALRVDAFVAITDVPKFAGGSTTRIPRLTVDRRGSNRVASCGFTCRRNDPKSRLGPSRRFAGVAKRAIVTGAGPEAIRKALDGAGTELKL